MTSNHDDVCCDLLSKNCIFDLINNYFCRFCYINLLWFAFKKLYLWLDKQHLVFSESAVNRCDLLSKNCIFDLINNTIAWLIYVFWLWFAFKKLYLWLDKQRKPIVVRMISSCDLLSKNCIFDLINNRNVVSNSFYQLWFAFKKLYLWLDKQRIYFWWCSNTCCDLLSKNCIFDLINNPWIDDMKRTEVVICFQKIVSLTW